MEKYIYLYFLRFQTVERKSGDPVIRKAGSGDRMERTFVVNSGLCRPSPPRHAKTACVGDPGSGARG
jgi:hypothetical protein